MLGARGDVSVQVSGNLRANDGDALRAAAIAGQGSDLPATFIVADDLRTGILVALTLDQWTVELAGIHAFIDLVVARFAPNPPWDDDVARLTLALKSPRAASAMH
jgi:DNA-binding transcriptional LysR family regulator